MIPLYGLVQDVFILETATGQTKRAYCIQHAHTLLRAHIDLHGEIPRILPSDQDTCALCDARARARSTLTALDPNLEAKCDAELGWYAVDVTGGVWWPSESASISIDASDDPERAVLSMASREPMRGRWAQ